ncbi:PREDICTED: tripartite motif-containing protein 3-like [Branchiostoma belcheri]|uniref:RING-type E3 ubiquitin transferase n=1 Tax=Branchiostoma belcheri TaxID=7741 RepID=A0A6P4ZZ31_BRABE|nr:PREDICTED: tripartite motif-containing protein 3-like [Branchiostoma belcheri]
MAAAPLSLGTQIREELSCSICLELFTRPKVLPCQHTFCQDCLQDHAGRGGTFQCPNCRRQVRLPPQGVAGLPDNHLVTSLCERLQNQATLSGETRQQPQSGNRCSFHPSEEVRLYCKQCNMPVCNECLDEIHSGHRTILTLKKASEERKAPVQALIVEGRTILETYCTSLRRLREREKALDEKKQEADSSIIQDFEREVQKATKKKDHLLIQEGEKYKENKKALQEERDRVLADVNELSAACDRAEHKLQQGGFEFLSQQTALTEVVGKYREKAAPTPVQTQPTYTTAFTLGTVAWLLLLAALLFYNPLYWPVPKTITFGGRGTGTGQLKFPSGVVVSDEGDIFVADRLNQRIQVFTLQGTFFRQFPTVVSGEQKMDPTDVAIDGEGNLWVVGTTETGELAVRYTKQGRVLRKLDLQKTGQLRGVAVDTRRNHILITQSTGDWPEHLHGTIQVFRPYGTLVRTVGQQQGMKYPRYITVDKEGRILVSDWDNDCVYVYNEDGQFLFKFGGLGSDEGQLISPRGICTDRTGNIFVADSFNKRVEMFDKTGKFLKHIATDMTKPHAVAMATQGQLVVTDLSENTVHIIHTY